MFSKKSMVQYFFLLSVFCLGWLHGFADVETPVILSPSQRAELNVIYDKAEKMSSQNLNRFAMEHLQYYDQLLDSFSTSELSDSVALLELEYKRSTMGRKDELAKNHFAIEELTNAKASNLRRYNNLLRKAGIAFAAWFVILLILLQIRKRHLKKQTSILTNSNIKLLASQNRADLGNKLIRANKSIFAHNEKISALASTLHQSVLKTANNPPQSPEKSEKAKEVLQTSLLLDSQASTELEVSRFLASLEKEPGTTTETLDINKACETVLEVVSRGASLGIPAEILSITKDLEKNLPKIPAVPEAVNALLLNILSNAFYAVQKKYDEGIKGYQPKVVLSTRILPRFLQIRIRDTGSGIPKDQLEKVQEEFFSLRPLEEGAGLGLSDSLQLLKEPHKGELRLESDAESGTDVYIKFYL